MPETLKLILEILAVIALVAANGYFVSAEFSLVKIRASQLYPLKKDGAVGVKCAIRATKHLDAVLSSTQLGVTLSSLALGWVGEPFVAQRLAPIFDFFGMTDPAKTASISLAVAFVLITFLHIVFGELAPKSVAIQYPKKTAIAVAAPLMVFYKIFFPFIALLNGTAGFFLRLAGIKTSKSDERGFSADELEYVLSHSRQSSSEDLLVNRVMLRALRLRDTRVNEIMIPRDEMNSLWINAPIDVNLRVVQKTAHSRYPVFGDNLDKPLGVLLVREWLWQMQILGRETPIEPILREVLKFPPDMPIADVLEKFRHSQNHIALVVNAEGRTLGLVSFEDILEEIVGDIRDEFETGEKEIFEQTQDSIVVAGTLNMHELEAETGWNFEWQGNSYETVASWVRSLRPGLPAKRGEIIRYEDLEIIPLETPAGSLKRILIRRNWGITKDGAE
ncbi:MAG: hemolysin family protein [Opitutae bacterium]|nr:hemolysin family protein [Opitutae bacterium]